LILFKNKGNLEFEREAFVLPEKANSMNVINKKFVVISFFSKLMVFDTVSKEFTRTVNTDGPISFLCQARPDSVSCEQGVFGEACIAYYYNTLFSCGFVL
jgi:hypothetical protein